jgi:hypothetical protein
MRDLAKRSEYYERTPKARAKVGPMSPTSS